MQQIIVDSPGVCLCYTGIQYRIVWSWNAQKRSEKWTASKRRVSQKLCIAHIHYSHKLVAHRAWLPLYKYCIPYVCRFTPTQLISKLTEKGLPQIGLVIDLTNTQNPTKYYDPQVWNTRHICSYILAFHSLFVLKEFKQKGIEHHKLPSGGHELPSEDVYRQ